MHSIRLVCLDSYQAPPIPEVDPTFSHFRGSEIKQVPILRIFGTTPAGEKACLHIHGVFPYLYIPYTGQIKADILAYRLAASLDASINVSLGSSRANTQHIYKIQQVSGIPFYGYHRKKHHFFKIYFYNPAMMKRAIELLQTGCILEQNFQPHEAHIPYTLQFMIDYNIYGMSMINLKNVKYRHPINSTNEEKMSCNSEDILNPTSAEMEYLPFSVTRQSVCQLEMDAWASDIINREVIDKGIDLNPGIAAIWEEEKARRAQAGLGGDSQLTYPRSPERSQAASILTDNDVYQQRRLAHRLCLLESQGDESSMTLNSDTSCYPIPVSNNSNLLNASQLEIHAGPLESSILQRSTDQTLQNVIDESAVLSLQSLTPSSDVSLNSSDYNIIEILANLAKNQDEIQSSIDSNSILGTQMSQNFQELQADQHFNPSDDEEEEVTDLNLTNFQLDTLNFSSWENDEKINAQAQDNESQIELVLETLSDPLKSNSPINIPQLDGPIDDENARMGPSNNDFDETIERKEFLICEYKTGRERGRSKSVTPGKRKRVSSSEDDDSNDSTKRKRIVSCLPKTPQRSPSVRSPYNRKSKLTSPSCPSRNYSPLCVEITSIQRTPNQSPHTTPSKKSNDRTQMRESFRRKRIFSPVKELNNEQEEELAQIEPNLKSPDLKNPISNASDLQHPISNASDIKNPISNASDLKNPISNASDLKNPISNASDLKNPISNAPENFIISEDAVNSDNTLVEDSDESLGTLILSPPQKAAIINETDSNDTTYSKEKKSDLSSCEFFRDTLPSLLEEEPLEENEISFSQLIESRQKQLSNQSIPPTSEKVTNKTVTIMPKFLPPSRAHIEETMENYGIAKCNNIEPFYSEEKDVQAVPQHLAAAALRKVRGVGLSSLPPFRSCLEDVRGLDDWRRLKAREFLFSGSTSHSMNLRQELAGNDTIVIEPVKPPPNRQSVEAWLKLQKKYQEKKEQKAKSHLEDASQILQESNSNNSVLDPALNLSKIFNVGGSNESSKHMGVSCGQIEFTNRTSIANVEDGNLGNAKALTTYQFLTVFCLEVHVDTRSGLLPDPRQDAIAAAFYAIHNDVPPDWIKVKPMSCGVIIVDANRASTQFLNSKDASEHSIIYVESEEVLLNNILSVIERCDPEILIGWDLEFMSWGYMFQRATVLGKNLSGKISRIPKAKCNWETATHDQSVSEMDLGTLADVKLPGRIVLDVWRIMRHEIALTSYTYENVMFNVMNERIPHPSFDVLSNWWSLPLTQWRVIDHYLNKVIGVHRLLHHLDIINRTSEHARLYGVQFYEVFSRGSQFRVESMMLRLAKPLNYIPVSPSAHQRGCMRAPESLPLIMEPESTMYSDPVVVLDFQSLYPSIIIAYNYCFSTCLGRVEHIGSPHPFEFGTTSLKVPKKLALKLKDKVNFAPCGVAFVKEEVRQGILPRMLTEILETRLMVKKAIKDHSKDDRALQRALHSRQLGLKLIANVTYGYTAANFSGRMPCIEVGDSVVSKGKETLERAIKIVESTPKWGARVIYGDTDSLFVLLKGKSREEAFDIGAEIADVVTAANPKPVKLKFEKVLQPAILQTKKRYCGYMYENLNDKPVYLAKGIETVRRDGCPAVAKILEKTLKILFDTKDLSQVKQYVIRQMDKILTGRASIQDLTFAKEFRGMKGYKAAACVPALELTRRLIQKDPRAVPRAGARVPYIIVAGAPNEPLIRCVKSPMELIQDPYLRPNAVYYITKVVIPPINRCLNLIGVDAYSWYMEMPHRQALNRVQGVPFANVNRKQKTTISQYLCNTTCPACGQQCSRGICADCIKNQTQTLIILHEKCRQYERIYSNIKMLCTSCIGVMDADSCSSLDCPIFYRRVQAQRDNSQISYINDLIQCMEHLT